MKKLFILFSFFVFLLTSNSFAQIAKSSWNYGIGLSYPKFVNHSFSYASEINFGGFFNIQRNFSEHVGIRFLIRFANLEGYYGNPRQTGTTRSISGTLGLVYYFVPCETVTPYFVFGGGPDFYMLDNQAKKTLDDFNYSYDIFGGLGFKWNLGEYWAMTTEFNYITAMDNKFDGIDGASLGGIFGGPYKSYFAIDLGFNYYFSKGEPSGLCSVYNGLSQNVVTAPVDYNKVEEIVKKYIPKEVVKEVVKEVAAPEKTAPPDEKWVLVGVNFESNSAKITDESYPILYNAVKTLLENPGIKIEIQGYTDNVGSEQYNLRLSQIRADFVKSYLISKGISPDRLQAVGYGESNPIADNRTAEGRAMNRRIEFKIQ